MTATEIISVDDDVIEPPGVWVDRLPAKYRDIGPRVTRAQVDGVDREVWAYEDQRLPMLGLYVAASFAWDAWTNDPVTYEEMRPGCYEPVSRAGAIGLAPTGALISTFSWCFSELLERYPRVKIVLSEGGTGWIPWLLERMDFTFEHQREVRGFGERLSRRPSEVFRDQFYGCFIDDEFGVRAALEVIGADRCMLEVEYPHSDSTWPDTQAVVEHYLGALSDADRHAVARGNAEQLFRFQPSGIGQL